MASSSAPRCPILDPTGSDPHTEAAALRARGPAVRVELPGGVYAWSVTRHSVSLALAGDPRISRDFHRHWPQDVHVPEGWPLSALVFQESFFNADGEDHLKARRRVAPAFGPRRVERMRPRVQATTDRLVEALAALPPGESADLRKSLSLPLTMTVICDLFGVPEPMRERIGHAIDDSLNSSLSPEEMAVCLADVDARLTELVSHKRDNPAVDLTGDLLEASDAAEEPIPEAELRGTLFALIGAGYETAVNLITSAVQALLKHPEALAAVREKAVGWTDVVEETLRVEAPAMHLPMRYALADIDLGEGVVIAEGDMIVIGFGAAGRDPALHPDRPDEFDPTRAGKEHLAFGFGPHFCLGAHLARLEAEVALSTLFDRLPDLALAHPEQQPPQVLSMVVNGPAYLEVIPHPAG